MLEKGIGIESFIFRVSNELTGIRKADPLRRQRGRLLPSEQGSDESEKAREDVHVIHYPLLKRKEESSLMETFP